LGYQSWHKSINTDLVDSYKQEQELLKALAVNDKKAIEKIYEDNYSLIQNLILNNSGTEEDAKDIFQEAVIILYEKSKSDSFELSCQIKTYVYSVCRRLWLKRLQYIRRYEAEIASLVEIVPVEEDMEEHDKRSLQFGMMEKAMTSIGEPCKSLLEAYYINKKSMQEIAENFGYTNADNAKNQKYKCLLRLKKLFFAQYKNGN
jgi:RNA polymerase sigma factor (sigma-70 family)